MRELLREKMQKGKDLHWLSALVCGPGVLFSLLAPKLNLASMVLTDASGFPIPSRLGIYEPVEMGPLANVRAHSFPYFVTSQTSAGLRLSLFAPVPAFDIAELERVIDASLDRLRVAASVELAARPVQAAPLRARSDRPRRRERAA